MDKLSNYPKGYLYFVLARFIGLSVKPLFLMFLLAYHLKNEAAMLSQIFLFLSGVFVLFAAPVHFEYYKNFFETEKTFLAIRKLYITYVFNLLLHVIIILPLIFLLCFFISKDLSFSILLTVMLLAEKSFDEVQRFLQFSKEFTAWSNIFLLKNLFPVLTTMAYIQLWDTYMAIYLYMILSIIAGIFIFMKYIPGFAKHKILTLLKTLQITQFKNYIKLFRKRYLPKYIQGISRANILNIDKWISLWLYSKHLLSELMLVGQFGNIINIGTNYATVSHRRAELLKSKNTVSTLLIGYKVPIVAFSLFLMVMIILFGFDVLTEKGISELNTWQIVALGLGYMLFSITQLLTEYLFWNGSMKRVLSIDMFYFIIIVTGSIYLYLINSYANITLFFLLGNIFRFLMQLIYVSTMGNEKNK